MKRLKSVSLILVCSILLIGCWKETQSDAAKRLADFTVESVEEKIESSIEEVNFVIHRPNYDLDNHAFTIVGKSDPEKVIKIYLEDESVAQTQPDKEGFFKLTATLQENEDTYFEISNGTDSRILLVKARATLESTNTGSKTTKTPMKENDNSKKQNADGTNFLDFQQEGMDNAQEYPAVAGAMLYSKTEQKFTGMNYFFEGEIIGNVKVESGVGNDTWLVKNSEGYILPIEYSYFTATIGDSVRVWGTLSGLGYSSADLGIDNVVGVTGSMHAMAVEVNGETQY